MLAEIEKEADQEIGTSTGEKADAFCASREVTSKETAKNVIEIDMEEVEEDTQDQDPEVIRETEDTEAEETGAIQEIEVTTRETDATEAEEIKEIKRDLLLLTVDQGDHLLQIETKVQETRGIGVQVTAEDILKEELLLVEATPDLDLKETTDQDPATQ